MASRFFDTEAFDEDGSNGSDQADIEEAHSDRDFLDDTAGYDTSESKPQWQIDREIDHNSDSSEEQSYSGIKRRRSTHSDGSSAESQGSDSSSEESSHSDHSSPALTLDLAISDKLMRLFLNVGPGFQLTIFIKPVAQGDVVGRRRLLGYVQKDVGKLHFSVDNHNFS